jgi:spermidine synthase
MTPDGAAMSLHEHDGSYCIRVNGQQLMHSSVATSELLLGEIGCERHAAKPHARFLIGGLGLGFTLKSLLDKVGKSAVVYVAELMPEIVAWNREHLSKLNGDLLDDPRVRILVDDVCRVILRSAKDPFDAIMLDIDNGTTAMVASENNKLYARSGINQVAAALKPGGRAVIWSACEDPIIEGRMAKALFKVKAVPAKLHSSAKRSKYVLYVGDKTETVAVPVENPKVEGQRT